jgi:hypothetical protein
LNGAPKESPGSDDEALSDPRFAKKLLTGDAGKINWDTSCNRCAIAMRSRISCSRRGHTEHSAAEWHL